jgi:DNA-binding beta-propeller fold protein YncE
MVAALAVTGCAAACLAVAGGTVASGSVAAVPGSVVPRPASAARFGALRPGLDGLHRAGRAAPGRMGNVAQAGPGRRGGFVVLGGSPGAPAANPKTGTVYVPIQCRTSFCASGPLGHVVDVINAAKCNTKAISGCRVVARARVGSSPLAAAIDSRTDTIYVVNGTSSTVSVLNGARCNARVTRGCGRPVATIKVGKFPVAAAFNPATRSLYVANLGGGSVSVINAARCNGRRTTGCGRPARTVKDKAGPAWIDVDTATDTVYAANAGASGNGDTVSVIDGATCNGHTGRGCRRISATVTVGGGPFGIAVDQASDTVYVPSNNAGTVSVINGARCNARTTAGCGRTPPAVTTGPGAQFVVVDYGLHTVFTINGGDDTLSAINTRTCDRRVASGCRTRPPSRQATPNQGPGFNSFPNTFALIPRTRSAYVVNVGGSNILSVTSVHRCNARNTSGCRRPAPAAGVGEFLLSADPATNTIYGGNLTQPVIDVINGATCHARRLADCTPVAQIPMPDPQANVGAIDEATHTLYAADESPSGTVAVINTAACNASHTAGCALHLPTVKIGAFPGPPAIDTATQTFYVSFGNSANRVAVVNAATCNATDTSGCGQAPAVVKVGQGTFNLAINAATDTVYGSNAGSAASGFTDGNTVSVINGATCNASDHSGCGHLAATATAGAQPEGIAVDEHTNTIYVANNADGDSPGTVSVINGTTCNGADTTGCGRHFPTAATGIAPVQIAIDTRTDNLYITDIASAQVTVLKGARCNAEVTSGCRTATREQAVGSVPSGLAINPRTRTVYVTNLFQAGSMSILRTTRH